MEEGSNPNITQKGEIFMRNEMRGLFFAQFALICLCMFHLSKLFDCSSTLWIGLSILFLIISIAFFLEARDSEATSHNIILPVGRVWTEFNCFQLKVDKVAIKNGVDGQRLSDVMFHVENWLTVLKQKENKLSVQMEAIAEQNNSSMEVEVLNASIVEVAAGEQQQACYTIALPEKAERIRLKFSVTLEHDEKVYQQQYEFYPAHYEK